MQGTATPIPDTDRAVEFLQKYDETGPWTVVAIQYPDNEARVRASSFTNPVALRNWIDEKNGKWNLYFTVNRCITEVTTTPKRHQMTHVRALHIDVDPPKGAEVTEDLLAEMLDSIRSFDPQPSIIIYSGGGYQAFWRFPEELPIDEWGDRVETANQSIQKQIGSADASVWNTNRLMRLPGTINILSPIKIKRGRTPGLAAVVEASWKTWSFKEDAMPTSTINSDDESTPIEPLEGNEAVSFIIDGLPAKLKKSITGGDASVLGGDRSRLVWYIICELVRREWIDEAIAAVILNPEYKCSAHCREQSGPEKYAQKQIDNARKTIATSWQRNEKNQIITNSQINIKRALVQLEVRFAHDVFEDQSYVNGSGPIRPLTDKEVVNLRLAIDEKCGFLPLKDLFFDIVTNEAQMRKFNPVQIYLDKLQWDHKPRIGGPDSPSWLTTYGGAEDSQYMRAVGRLALVAAVRRARNPGCKHDEILVLVSEKQGTNKSSALRLLARKEEWFSDSMPLHADEKKVIEQMRGKWIIECSELAGMKQAQVEEVKALLSRQVDHARPAYGRLPETYKRQCVFFGTTNTLAFLRDLENRRYWPAVITEFDLTKLGPDVDQLWAEAAYHEAKKESIELDKSLWPLAALVQNEHKVEEPWATILAEYLNDFDHAKIMTEDVWRILGKPGWQRLPTDNARLSDAMREIGWKRDHMRFSGSKNLKYGYKKNSHVRFMDMLYVTRDSNSGEIFVGATPREEDFESREEAESPKAADNPSPEPVEGYIPGQKTPF